MTWIEVKMEEGSIENYQISTFLEGVRVGSIVTRDAKLIMHEVSQRLELIRALAKGKVMAPIQG